MSVKFRMGVFSKTDKETDTEKRFDCALLASNSLKKYSKGIAYYDKAMHEKEAYEEKLMADMEKAIAERQFVVYYQPKYAIQGEKPRLSSAEALVRWIHPEFGMVSPGVFIPLFEKNGRIHLLDRYVWKCAAEQVADWRDRKKITLPVSVNISRIDLMEDGFVDKIKQIVREAGISSKEYMLEITESAAGEDPVGTIRTIKELREAGFTIEIDDFGTGYSSLNMLTSMPIDVLKLDRGFVKNIEADSKNSRLVEIVMEIAKMLDVRVVAEGVETEEQHKLLKDIGVDLIQGFYYSKPLAAEEFEKLIG